MDQDGAADKDTFAKLKTRRDVLRRALDQAKQAQATGN